MIAETEVWLFGSRARGDTDARSDMDILVVGEGGRPPLDLPFPADTLSVVTYSWPEIEHMAGYGSLFLLHVALEGQPMIAPRTSRLRALLDQLPPYARADHELACFVRVLDDVERSLQQDHAPAFEMSVVATALRHACILGCYALGRPTFGRESAFGVFLTAVGRSTLVDTARRLYDFRLYEDRRGSLPFDARSTDVEDALKLARAVLADVDKELQWSRMSSV